MSINTLGAVASKICDAQEDAQECSDILDNGKLLIDEIDFHIEDIDKFQCDAPKKCRHCVAKGSALAAKRSAERFLVKCCNDIFNADLVADEVQTRFRDFSEKSTFSKAGHWFEWLESVTCGASEATLLQDETMARRLARTCILQERKEKAAAMLKEVRKDLEDIDRQKNLYKSTESAKPTAALDGVSHSLVGISEQQEEPHRHLHQQLPDHWATRSKCCDNLDNSEVESESMRVLFLSMTGTYPAAFGAYPATAGHATTGHAAPTMSYAAPALHAAPTNYFDPTTSFAVPWDATYAATTTYAVPSVTSTQAPLRRAASMIAMPSM
jgi:hypothetical protein